MNTQMPILNTTGKQNSALPAIQADAFTATVPFNQVLNKEVNSRNSDTQNTAKNSTPTPAQATASTASKAPATSNAASSNNTQANNANSSNSSASATSKDKNVDADEDKKDSVDASTDDASAQLLALVANMGQLAVKPVTQKTAKNEGDSTPEQNNGKKPVQIGADAHKELAALQAQLDQGTEGKTSNLTDLQQQKEQSSQAQDDTATSKGKFALPAQVNNEKTVSAAADSANNKAIQADQQEKSAANLRANPETVVKPAETTQVNPTNLIAGMQQNMAVNQQAALTGQQVQKISPTVGSAGWDQAVGQKVVWMVNGGLQSASLTLNPPDLGPLQVVIHVNNSQADATFITAQPEVKQALEDAMPKLREMMDQAGVQLGQATVNTGTPNQQQTANQQQSRGGSGAKAGNLDNEDADLNVATITPRQSNSSGLGLVDTFA